MRTVALILMEAGVLRPGFHFRIENLPWMALVIEDLATRGPFGFRAVSVAHYGEQNGDPMRDPEMLFEMELKGGLYRLSPYYWRNDYVGIEQYSRFRDDDGNLLVLMWKERQLSEFADLWDNNLRSQGFVEAFRRNRQRTDRRTLPN
jgi:hypothetical protein